MDHKHTFAHTEEKVSLNYFSAIINYKYFIKLFYVLQKCNETISSCKPDLRQLTTRNLLDLEAVLKILMSDLLKKMFTGKMQTQKWTYKWVIIMFLQKQNKTNP